MSSTYRENQRHRIASRLLTVISWVMAFMFMFPVIWALFVSLNPQGQAIESLTEWFKPPYTLENYQMIFESSAVPRWAINSILITAASVILVLATSSAAAYALAKVEFPGRRALYFFFLLGLMVPGEATIVPLFLLSNKMGIIDSYAGLLLPGLASSFNLIIMTNFFRAFPTDLIEAARIDGASTLGIFGRVLLPNSKPVMVTVALFVFMGSWNSYLWPLLVAMSQDMFTLPVGLPTFVGTYSVDFTMPMTANMVAALPAIVVYLLAEKQIVEGITLSGVKG